MPAWARLAWTNRAQIIAVAKRLKWSRRNWIRLGALAVVAGGVYLAATYGYLERWNPTTFSNAQWAQLIVNLTGFVILFVAIRSWWGRQDEVWDEVDQVRTQIDEMRVALAELREFAEEHYHEEPEEALEEPVSTDTVNAIPSARPVPPPPVDRVSTTIVPAVRQAPISDRERPTVEREIGGRVFRFTVIPEGEESSEVG